jgi:hypothetical protein
MVSHCIENLKEKSSMMVYKEKKDVSCPRKKISSSTLNALTGNMADLQNRIQNLTD